MNEEDKKLAEQVAKDIEDSILGEFVGKVLPDHKASVDVEYLQKIKKKVEKILAALVKKYKLQDYVSNKLRYRVDYDKLYTSNYHNLFVEKRDIDGNQLKYGYEYIPGTFSEWIEINMPDYLDVERVYTQMCSTRRITKEDLILLNKIAKKYKVTEDVTSKPDTE